MPKKLTSIAVILSFLANLILPVSYVNAGVLGLPEPGVMVTISPSFTPVLMTGLKVYPENPLLFDFIVDTGHSGLKLDTPEMQRESERLIKYFLATLTIPEDDLWVNLSPYEKDRIIPEQLGQTEMGRDMLAQDYLLKQLSSSLIYPESDLGKEFWKKIRAKVKENYHTSDIPINTFNKVWILPDKAKIYVHDNTAFIIASHLKVMLDEDYLAFKNNAGNKTSNTIVLKSSDAEKINDVSSNIVREIILPEIEREINEGKNFAQLRQIYHSMILATWYKKTLKDALLNQVYADKSKIDGVSVDDKAVKDKIYQQYLQAYKKGVFNYIKEDVDALSKQPIPKKYFSGGEIGVRQEDITVVGPETRDADLALVVERGGKVGELGRVNTAIQAEYGSPQDAAMQTPVLPRINPKWLSWKRLEELAAQRETRYRLRDLFARDPQRAERFLVELNPHVEVDFSKNLMDEETLEHLLALTEEVNLPQAIEQMFQGEKINETEGRAVLHVALRNVKRGEDGRLIAANGPVFVDGKDVMPEVIAVLEKMEAFTKKIHSGAWRGASGKRIRNVVNIGIGGSDLGPKMAVEALRPFKAGDVEVYFLSNIDGTAAAELMKKLDPEETLFYIISKSFTTSETKQNAETMKKWVLDTYRGDQEAIKKHFVAVSTAEDLVVKFGIEKENMFGFWDWVGGRFSVWSAVGLSLATFVGFDNFLRFLEGAREADEHFRTQPFRQNISVLKALLNVWYGNFLGAESFAILPYDQYMRLFPDFTQQFFMESEGKGVDRDGIPVDYHTGLIAWGAIGTDSQHAFVQLFHQGTRLIPVDYIGILRTHNPLPGHHDKFFSNFVAQTEALAFGATTEEVRTLLAADPKYQGKDIDWHAMHQTFPGNRPTTSILIDQMTPEALGSLIALYEHQIFTESIIWNIFAFDQWGVQLGKTVADKRVLPFLTGARSLDELPDSGLSLSAQRVIKRYLAVPPEVDAAMGIETVDVAAIFPDALTVDKTPGTSGWRTRIGDTVDTGPFNRHNVGLMAQAWADYLKNDPDMGPGDWIEVAFDVLPNSDVYALRFVEVLLANGFNVKLGEEGTTTPSVIYQTNPNKAGSARYGFHITASHNPPTYNGIKFIKNGVVAPDSLTVKIGKAANRLTTYHRVNFLTDNFRAILEKEELQIADPVGDSKRLYQSRFRNLATAVQAYKAATGADIVLDLMHGAASAFGDDFEALGVEVIADRKIPMREMWKHQWFRDQRFEEKGKGLVPYRPEPKENFLSKTDFEKFKATAPTGSLYMAIDGDGDRLAIFVKRPDGSIQEVAPNDLGVLYSWYLIKNKLTDGRRVIAKTQPTTSGMDFVVEWANKTAPERGEEPDYRLVITPVGSKHFGPDYQSGQLLVGTEESGHQVVKEFFDDASGQAHFVLEILARTGKSLSEVIYDAKDEIGQVVGINLNEWIYDRINPDLTEAGKTRFVNPIKTGQPEEVVNEFKKVLRGKQIREIRMTTIDADYNTGDITFDEFVRLKAESRQPVLKENEGMILFFEDGSWLMARISGTEGVVRLYAEAANEGDVQFLQNAAKEVMGIDPGMVVSAEDQDSFYGDEFVPLGDDDRFLKGGIEFNANKMTMDVSGEEVNIHFDPAMLSQFEQGNFSGVRPIILNIFPIPAALPLFGIKETEEDEKLAGV